jgi:NAD(P)-dependent dehydrogenase (short-subunit alcohol dehydrogenase family)
VSLLALALSIVVKIVRLSTALLLPALQAAAPARVIVLSSSAHRRSGIDFDDIHYRHRLYDKWEAYGQSKTANALFAVGLTRHVGNQGITVNAINPGAIRTSLQQHLSPEDLLALGWIDEEGHQTHLLNWKTPEQGAATSVWAAVGQELEGIGVTISKTAGRRHHLNQRRPAVMAICPMRWTRIVPSRSGYSRRALLDGRANVFQCILRKKRRQIVWRLQPPCDF